MVISYVEEKDEEVSVILPTAVFLRETRLFALVHNLLFLNKSA